WDTVIREVQPLYDLARQKSDQHIAARLAVWLCRADAFDRQPFCAIDEPCSQEVRGHWRAAAEGWKNLGCSYEYASLIALRGSESEKREALAIFEGLGASAAARALRRQFRAEGVRGVPRGVRPSTQSNPFGLTRREAEVLELLSEGLRNAG